MCVYIKGFVDGDVDCFQSGYDWGVPTIILHTHRVQVHRKEDPL